MPIRCREFLFDNPPFASCHAATIVETPAGLVAAFFAGTHESHPDTGIWTMRHDGTRWHDLREVVNGRQPDGGQFASWNPVLFTMPDGELLLFYKVGPSPSRWWGMLVRSFDNGETWSEPERLPDGILGPIKNKPVLLDDGTLICPSSKESKQDGWQVFMERTGDGGRTWEITAPLNDGHHPEAIQPTLLIYGDTIFALCRTQTEGYIACSRSLDRGITWSELEAMTLPNPNSGIDAVRLQDGRALLVYNHLTIPPGGWTNRSPIHLAVANEPNTWEAALILESEPGEYSYPAIIQSADGLVHIVYTHQRTNIRYIVIDPSRLSSRPIIDGRWPSIPNASN